MNIDSTNISKYKKISVHTVLSFCVRTYHLNVRLPLHDMVQVRLESLSDGTIMLVLDFQSHMLVYTETHFCGFLGCFHLILMMPDNDASW